MRLTQEQADAVETEMRALETDPNTTVAQMRLFMQWQMPCGHAAGNLLTCDSPPFGCVICNRPDSNESADLFDALANLEYETMRIDPTDPDALTYLGGLSVDFSAVKKAALRLMEDRDEWKYEAERSVMACDTWSDTYLRAKNQIAEALGDKTFDPDLALEAYVHRLTVALTAVALTTTTPGRGVEDQ